MSMVSDCPACGTGKLSIVPHWNEGMQLYYTVDCQDCGVEFHHERFYAYNEVVAFFESQVDDRFTEDVSTRLGIFKCARCGCTVEEQGVDYGEINFCPDCGYEVSKW